MVESPYENSPEMRQALLEDMHVAHEAMMRVQSREERLAEDKWITEKCAVFEKPLKDCERFTRKKMQNRLLQIFNIVFSRASVAEKQVLCSIKTSWDDVQVVVGKYGLGIQKRKQARHAHDWEELQWMLNAKDAIIAAMKASSKPGVVELAPKFELFASLVKGVDEMQYEVWTEMLLVKPLVWPLINIERSDEYEWVTISAYIDYNGVAVGVREKTYQERRSRNQSWTSDGIHHVSTDLKGAWILCALEKDWDYYRVRLVEQLQTRYGPGRLMLSMVEEAFSAELLVATL